MTLPLIRKSLGKAHLEFVREYSTELESLLRKEVKDFAKRFEERYPNIPQEWKQEYEDSESEKYQQLQQLFPNQLRYGIVVSIHTVLEDELTNICNGIKQTQHIRVAPTDLKGDALARAWVYLTKVASLPINATVWGMIEPYSVIRNFVVHQSGRFPVEHGKSRLVANFCKATKLANIDENHTIWITPKFCDDFCERAETLLVHVCDVWGASLSVSPAT